ncbi:unnamed protein product, partial [Ixodes pacificus]
GNVPGPAHRWRRWANVSSRREWSRASKTHPVALKCKFHVGHISIQAVRKDGPPRALLGSLRGNHERPWRQTSLGQGPPRDWEGVPLHVPQLRQMVRHSPTDGPTRHVCQFIRGEDFKLVDCSFGH